MRSATRWTTGFLWIGMLIFLLPAVSAGAPTANKESDPAAPEPTVEPVAGVSYANAAPLSTLGSGAHNYFGFQVSFRESFDDNVFVSEASRRGAFVTEVTPEFLFGRASRRAQLQVSYRPGLRIYHRFSDQNTVTHNLLVDYNYRASKRWTLSFGNRFQFFPGTDSAFTGDGSNRSLDPLLGAQPVAATLREGVFSNSDYFQAQYQWSLRSYVALATTYRERRHAGDSFVDARGASGRASYNYRYGRRGTFAATYQYDRVWLGSGFGQTESHAVLLGNSFRLGQRMSVNLSVGPSYSIFDGQQNVTLSPLLAFLLGAPTVRLQRVERHVGLATTGRFAYNFTNASVELSYARGMNGGGDVYGSARTEFIRFRLQRKVSRGSDLSLQGHYGTNSFARGELLPITGTKRVSGQIQFSHRLTDSASLLVGYRYIQQLVADSPLDDDRHEVTLGFTFSLTPGNPGR